MRKRQRGRKCSYLLTISLTIGALIAPASPALASDPDSSGTVQAQWQGSTSFSSTAVDAAYNLSYSSNPYTYGAGEKNNFLSLSAEDGFYYDYLYVDYLGFKTDPDLLFPDIEVVAPKDYDVDTVQAASNPLPGTGETGNTEYAYAAGMGGKAKNSTPVSYPSGPGFGSWEYWGHGSYNLVISGVGNMYSTWYKNKFVGDNSSTYDFYAYRRKGRATPKDISGPNFKVAAMTLKSYPGPYTAQYIVKDLIDWSPGGNFTGNCDTSNFNASVTYGAISIGLSFFDCEGYKIYIDETKPGTYQMKYDPGLYIGGGARETGFTWEVATANNNTPTIYDYQYVSFITPSSYPWQWVESCSATNSGKTCY